MACTADYKVINFGTHAVVSAIGINPGIGWKNTLTKQSDGKLRLVCTAPYPLTPPILTPFVAVTLVVGNGPFIVIDDDGEHDIGGEKSTATPPTSYSFEEYVKSSEMSWDNQVEIFLDDLRSDSIKHKELYPEFYQCDHGEIAEYSGNPEQDTKEYALRYLTVCRDHTILKTDLPKCIKLDGWTLRCANHWTRIWIRVCHPSANEVWSDISECIGLALVAAGGVVAVGAGGAAWAAFVAIFKACIVGKVGDWGSNIKLSLHSKDECGPWGKC